MTEISPLPQELARFNTDGQIAMAMTGRAFDEARKAGVIAINPLVENIRGIATATEYIADDEPLPPLLLFVRSSSKAGKNIGRWDDRWPTNDKQPQSGMYFSAASIGEAAAKYGSMADIAEYAEAIGATAITEISVPLWKPENSFIGQLATGFALGQRPVRPPAAKSLFRQATGLLSDTNSDQAALGRIKRVQRRTDLREPLSITYRSSLPQIGA